MSFMKPTTTFSRFRIVSQFADSLWSEVPDRLRQFAFRSIDDIPEDESWGWSTFHDCYDTEWRSETPIVGAHYICFGLRGDVRRIPPEVMSKGVYTATKEEEKRNLEQGKKYISRERKAEIREQVKLRLRARFLPIPSHFPVIWNWESGEVWISSNQTKQLNKFVELFTRTFGVDLLAVDPYSLVGELHPLDDLSQIGCDFLLWLWYNSENGPGVVSSKGDRADIFVQSNVTIQSREGNITVTGSQDTKEALIGITQGKKITSLQLSLCPQPEEYKATIRASDLSFSSVKTPVVDTSDDDPDSALLEKIYLLERFLDFVDTTYSVFVNMRVNEEEWNKRLVEFEYWMTRSLTNIMAK